MKHKERVERVKNFTEKNKVFVIMAVIAVIFLCSNFFFSKENETVTNETSQSETAEKGNSLEWKFYPIDAWILLTGGGFCIIMILKEKRKSKEKLQ